MITDPTTRIYPAVYDLSKTNKAPRFALDRDTITIRCIGEDFDNLYSSEPEWRGYSEGLWIVPSIALNDEDQGEYSPEASRLAEDDLEMKERDIYAVDNMSLYYGSVQVPSSMLTNSTPWIDDSERTYYSRSALGDNATTAEWSEEQRTNLVPPLLNDPQIRALYGPWIESYFMAFDDLVSEGFERWEVETYAQKVGVDPSAPSANNLVALLLFLERLQVRMESHHRRLTAGK